MKTLKRVLFILGWILAVPLILYIGCVIFMLGQGCTLSEALFCPLFLALVFVLHLFGYDPRWM